MGVPRYPLVTLAEHYPTTNWSTKAQNEEASRTAADA